MTDKLVGACLCGLQVSAGDGGPACPRVCKIFRRYVCLCVCLRVIDFSDASFKTFGLIFKISIGAVKIKN